MTNKKRNGLIMIGCFVIVAALFLFNLNSDTEIANSEGFTSEPVTFEGISYQLTGSSSVEDTHTFYLNAKNLGNKAVNPKAIFYIMNEDKKFSVEEKKFSSTKLNPGIDGTIELTFIMKKDDLINGKPKLVIDRGIIVKDIQEIELTN